MVLAYWVVSLSPHELESAFSSATSDGVKARDLRDFARKKGLKSYLIHGQWEDLEKEVRQGRPVIVGLVKPYVSGGLTHYEVVVAIHPDQKKVVTLDPGRGWRQNSQDGFRLEWEPAGYLTMVFFREETPPSQPNP
jgi:hypothetical protein